MREYIDAVRLDCFDENDSCDGFLSCRSCGLDFALRTFLVAGTPLPINEGTLHSTKLIAAISADCASGHPVKVFRCDGKWAGALESQ
jgi:hypothetical protein